MVLKIGRDKLPDKSEFLRRILLWHFFPPIPLIRRNVIVKRLRACNATSEKTAKTLTEAGVINPNGFKRITDRLVETGVIHKTQDNKYYV